MSLTGDWLSLGLAALAVVGVLSILALAAVAIALRALRGLSRIQTELAELRQDYQQQNTTLLALRGAMKMIAEDVISQGQSNSAVQRTLERLSEQHGELRLRDVDDGLYGQAIELIRQGTRREEVRRLCALTDAEVDLLFSLHGQGLGGGS